VDNVVFNVKGAAELGAACFGPIAGVSIDRYVYINGKRVYDFNFQLQTFLASRGVGVICHEFFHTLGAPDLYHYTDNGIDPAGSWDIMETDKNPPST
jgi:M6 family metalloprotease-like protein